MTGTRTAMEAKLLAMLHRRVHFDAQQHLDASDVAL